MSLAAAPDRPVLRVPAAAPRRVADLLAGPPHPAVVVHAGVDAAYLHLGGDLTGGCIGLLAASAYALPCGLRTTLRALDLERGTAAVVGDGALRVGPYDVRVGRFVDATVPGLPQHIEVAPVLGHPAVVAVRDELPADALRRLAERSPSAVHDLIGRGSGLTPVGDDVVCGFLAGLRAAGDEASGDPVATEARWVATRRTTVLSRELIACAAAGDVLPEFADLVRNLAAPTTALARLVSVGHTSGAGLALGLALALSPSGRTQS